MRRGVALGHLHNIDGAENTGKIQVRGIWWVRLGDEAVQATYPAPSTGAPRAGRWHLKMMLCSQRWTVLVCGLFSIGIHKYLDISRWW
jgi:hypothetical protein